MNDRAIGRAGFLGILGAGALGLFLARDVTGLLGRAVPKSVRRSCRRPAGASTRSVVDARIAPAAYRLRVDGLVGAPQTFTLADLKAMPRAEQVSDFHCVTGLGREERPLGRRPARRTCSSAPARSAASRAPVRLRRGALRGLADPKQALLPDVMLAYEMDGKPLSRPHGAPVRLVMPQMYGTRASSG